MNFQALLQTIMMANNTNQVVSNGSPTSNIAQVILQRQLYATQPNQAPGQPNQSFQQAMGQSLGRELGRSLNGMFSSGSKQKSSGVSPWIQMAMVLGVLIAAEQALSKSGPGQTRPQTAPSQTQTTPAAKAPPIKVNPVTPAQFQAMPSFTPKKVNPAPLAGPSML